MHTVPKEISGYNFDKHYIGITGRDVRTRWGNNGCGYQNKDNLYFHNAIVKYGWDNIRHEILMSDLTMEEACYHEKKLIAKYKSNIREFGYNISPGGYNGGGNSKNIAQYDLNGNLLEVYSNGSEAARKATNNRLNTSSSIYRCAREETGEAYGYMWRYCDNDVKLKIQSYQNKCYKKILQYDIYGNFIKEWNNIAEAERYYNSCGSIQNACLKSSNTAKGYQWKYKDDDREICDISKYDVKNVNEHDTRNKPVYAYTIQGIYVGHFYSIKSAVKELGLKCKSIPKKCFDDITNNYALGYRWTLTYYAELPPLNNFVQRGTPIVQIDISTNKIINIFYNAINASKYIKKENASSSILKCCNKKKGYYTAHGYKWEFITQIKESDITDSFLLQKYKEIMNKYNKE